VYFYHFTLRIHTVAVLPYSSILQTGIPHVDPTVPHCCLLFSYYITIPRGFIGFPLYLYIYTFVLCLLLLFYTFTLLRLPYTHALILLPCPPPLCDTHTITPLHLCKFIWPFCYTLHTHVVQFGCHCPSTHSACLPSCTLLYTHYPSVPPIPDCYLVITLPTHTYICTYITYTHYITCIYPIHYSYIVIVCDLLIQDGSRD